MATDQPNLSSAAASPATTFTRSEKSSLSRRFLPASLPRRIARASSRPHAWGAAAARQIKANACIVGLPDARDAACSTRARLLLESDPARVRVGARARWPVNRDARKHTHTRYDGARAEPTPAARWRRRAARTCAAASSVSPKPTTPRRGPGA